MNPFLNHFVKRDKEYDELSESLRKCIRQMESVLLMQGIIRKEQYESILVSCEKLSVQAQKKGTQLIFIKDQSINDFHNVYQRFQNTYDKFESDIDAHNAKIWKSKIADARKLIGPIDGYDLDDQQLFCIVKDAHSHNVIAGAGTGKTTTIVGKVKYLIQTGKMKQEEILVVSFTRAAAQEMKTRLVKNGCRSVCVSTIHRLGYSIVTATEHRKPSIFTEDLSKLIRDSMLKHASESLTYAVALLQYIGSSASGCRSDLDDSFKSADEYRQYIQKNEPTTLKGEKVKSLGEVHVANILAILGVNYQYEHPYEFDTATEEHRQYYPDFYLPDYKTYIEFFGIDKNGNVPDWFEGDDPSKTYQEGMEWKRRLHKQNGTKLIECYAYEDKDGTLYPNLKTHLEQEGVIFHPEAPQNILNSNKDSYQINEHIRSFISSTMSVINLARNNKISPSELKTIAGNNPAAKAMAYLAEPIQKDYEEHLKETETIDFADMLVKAENYVSEGKWSNPFSCLIVDEYQDITAAQFRLLKALRNSKNYELFCVGDDWQSIYRFNGSDVSYITNFGKYWEDSSTSRIETTYRYSQSLCDISSWFIMQNPKQLKKNIRSNRADNEFALSKIEGYKVSDAIRFMTDHLLYLPRNSTVFLLGRYNFDIKLLKQETRIQIRNDPSTGMHRILLNGREDLNIKFITAHRSKGLQADYIFILNNMNGTLGFPSKVEDNALADKLLQDADDYPYAEERRLFYVAMTRAKKHVYLLTQKNHESCFEKELEQMYGSQIINETYVCPICGGKLRMIDGQYGKFLGCENYRITGCKFKSIIKNTNDSTDLQVNVIRNKKV